MSEAASQQRNQPNQPVWCVSRPAAFQQATAHPGAGGDEPRGEGAEFASLLMESHAMPGVGWGPRVP